MSIIPAPSSSIHLLSCYLTIFTNLHRNRTCVSLSSIICSMVFFFLTHSWVDVYLLLMNEMRNNLALVIIGRLMRFFVRCIQIPSHLQAAAQTRAGIHEGFWTTHLVIGTPVPAVCCRRTPKPPSTLRPRVPSFVPHRLSWWPAESSERRG